MGYHTACYTQHVGVSKDVTERTDVSWSHRAGLGPQHLGDVTREVEHLTSGELPGLMEKEHMYHKVQSVGVPKLQSHV